MTAATLTADGSTIILAPPSAPDGQPAYAATSYAALGHTIFVTYQNAWGSTAVDGYSTAAVSEFEQFVGVATGAGYAGSATPVAAVTGDGNFVIGWSQIDFHPGGTDHFNSYAIFSPDGVLQEKQLVGTEALPAELFGAYNGFRMEYDAILTPPDQTAAAFQYTAKTVGGPFAAVTTGNVASSPAALTAYAETNLFNVDGVLQIVDNVAQLIQHPGKDTQTVLTAITLPGEPAHAVTEETAAALSDLHRAAVAWADSGTDYVSIYDATTNSFGPTIGLDWGGVSDLHLVSLLDGGFVVSWMNGGAYKGEVFDSAGNGGGVTSLAGDAAGIDSHGDLYTVALDPGGPAVQTYAISGGSSGGDGGTTGQTFTSDDNGDVWVGTAGDDVFHLGRGGDWVAGNGGNDTFTFAGVPWAGGHITDFGAGDVLGLTGLMATTSDTGTDGFADGYLQITDDGQGNAQVWADYHIPGNDGWWLVETLDGVAPASLQHAGAVISIGSPSGGGPTDVSTAEASYTAPASVKTITLTGSHQTIDATATSGVTVNSNDTGNALLGGGGDDTFHIGRGGDWIAGGAGADTFAYSGTPWAGGGITDFNAAEGDKVDVSGLLHASGYSGSDPFADGYLQLTSDNNGAQLWSDVHQPGNDGWWLVTTLDGVPTSSLHYSGGLIT